MPCIAVEELMLCGVTDGIGHLAEKECVESQGCAFRPDQEDSMLKVLMAKRAD